MYEAVRQRAPNSPQIAGAATAALMTALAGYALANGFAAKIVQTLIPETVFSVLPPVEDKQEPVETKLPETNIELTMEKPLFIPEKFKFDDPPLVVKEGPEVSPPPGPTITRTSNIERILPRLRPTNEKPPYPLVDVRAGNQGTTGLEVCVDARGRVTSASLKQSSGHARLDEAALKWVRGARFTPGSVDGAPQAMCGHNVFYEWKLENARS